MSAIPCSSVSLKTMADGTLRISFDFEPMHAQDAFKLFAAPGTPAAIAALQAGYLSKNDEKLDTSAERVQKTAETEHEKPKGGPLAKLAGMWSADPEFWKWASNNVHRGDSWNVEDANSAAEFIRKICEVSSRADLDHDDYAESLFHAHLRGPFQKYLIARGIVR